MQIYEDQAAQTSSSLEDVPIRGADTSAKCRILSKKKEVSLSHAVNIYSVARTSLSEVDLEDQGDHEEQESRQR